MTLLPPSAIDGLRSARVRTRESGLVQVFSGACMKTNHALDGRRPRSAKAGNRGGGGLVCSDFVPWHMTDHFCTAALPSGSRRVRGHAIRPAART